MNTFLTKCCCIAAFLHPVIAVRSQNVAQPYEIGTWEDFRQSAISWTFDDGCSNQFLKALPLFDDLGFKGTFFTVTSWSPGWTTLKMMASNGHEIASHCVNHTSFATLSDSLQRIQLKNSQLVINSNIKVQPCVTIAYPYCVAGNKTLCSSYYIAARGCQGFTESKTPSDFMNVSSIICGSEGSLKTYQHFKSKIDNVVNVKGWAVFLIHGIDNDGGYSPLESLVLGQALNYCHIRNYKCWVSTFGNISRYIKERNSASVAEMSASDSAIVLKVTDSLADSLYNYPITIRRPLPLGWSNAKVTQDGQEVKTLFTKPDTEIYLMFSVIPDGGDVVLSRISGSYEITDQNYELPDTTVTSQSIIPVDGYPASPERLNLNYSDGELRFELPSGCGKNIRVSLYTISGVLFASYDITTPTGRSGSINLAGNKMKPGYYIVRVSDGKTFWSESLLL